MAYGQDKYQEVESLLESGVSVRQAAAQSSCSLTFVKKVRAAIKDRLPKSKQGGTRKPTSKKMGSSGHSKPVSAPNKKKTQKDTSPPPEPPKTAWQAVSEQKEHKKTQAKPAKAPPPDADLNLTPEQIDIEHKNAVRQLASDIMFHYKNRDFNALKCAKITLEAVQIASAAERKWHQIENGGKEKENKFNGLVFEVVGGGSIETEDLPNQDEHNWPNPNQ